VDGYRLLVSLTGIGAGWPTLRRANSIRLDAIRASILLTHAPDHPEIAEAAVCFPAAIRHTHLGQFIPWSWMARRIYRQFVMAKPNREDAGFHFQRSGNMGLPLRLEINPEIVVLSSSKVTRYWLT